MFARTTDATTAREPPEPAALLPSRAMTRSKPDRSRYRPPPKKKRKSSPKWFGALILAVFGISVAVIILNYLNLIPGGTSGWYLIGGLAGIAIGFILATQWY